MTSNDRSSPGGRGRLPRPPASGSLVLYIQSVQAQPYPRVTDGLRLLSRVRSPAEKLEQRPYGLQTLTYRRSGFL